MFGYLHWDKPWILSDILSICILGSLIKLFKIVSMKDSIKFFLPCTIFEICAFIYVSISVRYVR